MTISDARNHLLIFARQPELGRVKTRLARGIGAAAALAVYEELLAHTRAVAAAVPATTTVWLAEAPRPHLPDAWPDFPQRAQPPGDLGQRMQHAFAAAFAGGAARVVIVGTDCPSLTAGHLTAAFAHLAAATDLVLGPATDGGYYLLGMKQLQPALFQHKAWSTATVLPDTLADAARLNLTVQLLSPLRDVDTVDDLVAWRGEIPSSEKQT